MAGGNDNSKRQVAAPCKNIKYPVFVPGLIAEQFVCANTNGANLVSDQDKKKLHYHGHRQRLRERFLKSGLDDLAEYEIVELFLTLVIPRADVKPLAKSLVEQFGNLHGILNAQVEELLAVPGIGKVTPVALKLIKELAARYLQEGTQEQVFQIESSKLADFWRMRIGALQHEVFEVAYLDGAGRVLSNGVITLEEGTIDRATVYPRRVIEGALKRGAAGLVLAHNHPNGDLAPSEQDKLLTRAIVLAAETIGLKIVDHLIITARDTFSFRVAGLL